jgi:predicted nucleic acid-binding protein
MWVMTQLRVYLDTSVFSALLDEDAPERRALTRTFWSRRNEYLISTSDVARVELDETPDQSLRSSLVALLDGVVIHPATAEINDLAMRYIAHGVFTIRTLDDALHVAAAVMTRQDVLLSWNFTHLVKRSRRAAIDAVNLAANLPTIDIISPPEL